MNNKVKLSALVFGSILSASAFANTGTINFIGSVSDTTCDFVGEQGGTQTNTIDLGTYTIANVNSGSTNVVDFSLVGKKSDGTACEVAAGKSVDVSWVPASGSWNPLGLQNTGTAVNTAVKLMDKNGNAFSSLRDTVNYLAADVSGGALPFKAQLVKSGGDATAGTVISAVKFAVAYK
ncbi:TPA: fimbrial protein [Photobacterium damselae]